MTGVILHLGLVMPDLQQPEFNRLVRARRQRSGLTQTELATKIEVSYDAVNRWENQATMLTTSVAKRIEAILPEMGDARDVTLDERGADWLEPYFPTENRK
jgi:ribosome-binding protein aMBF1 (putative translation factor)